MTQKEDVSNTEEENISEQEIEEFEEKLEKDFEHLEVDGNIEIAKEGISTGDLSKKWRMFRQLTGNEYFNKVKRYVKQGIWYNIPILYISKEENVEERYSHGNTKVKGMQKINIEDFNEDKEMRIVIMDKCFSIIIGDSENPERQK